MVLKLWKIFLLCASIEKVKVPKLEANPLSRLSYELVRTVQRLWVRSRVRRRKQLLATVPENRECEETIRGKDWKQSSWKLFSQDFHLPRNLFPWMAKLHSRLFPSTRPSGTPIFVNRAAEDHFSIFHLYLYLYLFLYCISTAPLAHRSS